MLCAFYHYTVLMTCVATVTGVSLALRQHYVEISILWDLMPPTVLRPNLGGYDKHDVATPSCLEILYLAVNMYVML